MSNTDTAVLRAQLAELAEKLDQQAVATSPVKELVDESNTDDVAEFAYDSGAADALESAALWIRELLAG